MKRAILEWMGVAAVFAIAAFVRYQLIQPPEVAQACELAGAPWWCEVRMLVIRSFANFGLGYAAMVMALLTVITRNRWVAWVATMVGAAGLSLYCYEPAAVSFVVGVLVLARAQSGQPRVSLRKQTI